MFDINNPVFYIFIFFVGACLGSFANVVIHRMPLKKSLVRPGSACASCDRPIPWYDLIPIVSWFALRGKCRQCQSKYSWRYPLVEFLMAAGFYLNHLNFGISITAFEYDLFVFGLIVVSFIDFDHMILPDSFTLSGIVIGLVFSFFSPDRTVWDSLLGILMGGGFLWLISYFYFLWRKEEGMGGGDIKLLGWIGAVLGWKSIPFVILAASLAGTIVGLAVAFRKKEGLKTAIPFGPYLAMGALLHIYGGQGLGAWYLGLFLPGLMD